MVLGHDFHSLAGYEWNRRHVAENLNSPTWRHLRPLLRAVRIPLETCFFTNVYMGLREGPATTGLFPGSSNSAFVSRCRLFFIRQLQVQRPRIILALGAHVRAFLAPLSPELSGWATCDSFRQLDAADHSTVAAATFAPADHTCALVALTHPCFRPANVRHRRWRTLRGDLAEVRMVRHALSTTVRVPLPQSHREGTFNGSL